MGGNSHGEDLILTVDDEPSISRLVSRFLERKGYQTRAASSGQEAIDLITELAPVAIVSDIRMPGLDGLALLSHVMQCDPDMVVILTTGAPSMAITIEAMRAGASDFLPKPIDLNRLGEALERGITRRRARLASQRRQLELELQVRTRTRELHDTLDRLQNTNLQLQEAYEESIELLRRTSAIRDNDTGNHIERIREFSGIVGRELGLSQADLHILQSAAPMHDIGKIGIPDQILRKPGKLTPEEFDIMKTHTTIGAQILGGRETPLLKASEIIALTHHERWDGKGYPYGLAGEEIPLFGRIVAVVDVFDALTHERCYKPAIETSVALQILREARGTQFDPDALDAFLSVSPLIIEVNERMGNEDYQHPLRLPR